MQGTNFDFLALNVLQEHMNNSKIVLEFLVNDFLSVKNEQPKIKSEHFKCNIALITAVLNQHHNITINISYNKFRFHFNKLNNNFSLQDFLLVNELKENKLFSTSPRISISS